MALPPIPQRKGMVPYSAHWDGERWRHVQYRTEEQARIAARGGIADCAKIGYKPPDPTPRPSKPMKVKKARGIVAVEQGELDV